jgi:hypothetical protein
MARQVGRVASSISAVGATTVTEQVAATFLGTDLEPLAVEQLHTKLIVHAGPPEIARAEVQQILRRGIGGVDTDAAHEVDGLDFEEDQGPLDRGTVEPAGHVGRVRGDVRERTVALRKPTLRITDRLLELGEFYLLGEGERRTGHVGQVLGIGDGDGRAVRASGENDCRGHQPTDRAAHGGRHPMIGVTMNVALSPSAAAQVRQSLLSTIDAHLRDALLHGSHPLGGGAAMPARPMAGSHRPESSPQGPVRIVKARSDTSRLPTGSTQG